MLSTVTITRDPIKSWPCVAVQVLTTGSWPTQMAAKCNLPRELEQCCKAFQDYYLKAHSGRKLSWQTNMGNADLKARTVRRCHRSILLLPLSRPGFDCRHINWPVDSLLICSVVVLSSTRYDAMCDHPAETGADCTTHKLLTTVATQ